MTARDWLAVAILIVGLALLALALSVLPTIPV